MLNGAKSLVPRAATAELFVVAADLEGTPALFIVESGTSGVRHRGRAGDGPARRLDRPAGARGRRRCRPARCSAARRPTSTPTASGSSRIGWAALACGTGKAVLDYVIPYVNDRVAFGEPISHRQAVAFMVADIGIELEGARLVTLRAAARAEQGKSFAREAGLARRLTAEYGMKIGSSGVQLLGGHGYVKEHPVERWYRDLRAAGVMEGVVPLRSGSTIARARSA